VLDRRDADDRIDRVVGQRDFQRRTGQEVKPLAIRQRKGFATFGRACDLFARYVDAGNADPGMLADQSECELTSTATDFENRTAVADNGSQIRDDVRHRVEHAICGDGVVEPRHCGAIPGRDVRHRHSAHSNR